jgi:hypothetical protein
MDTQGKLEALLAGKAAPADAALGLQVAVLAQKPFNQRYRTAARLYRDALARQPRFVARHRYNAACAAVQAGCGQGKEVASLDEMERLRWRRQALTWLRADLCAWKRQLGHGAPRALAAGRQILQHWKKDPDLAVVRNPESLARLTEEERTAWCKLWADVAAGLALSSP